MTQQLCERCGACCIVGINELKSIAGDLVNLEKATTMFCGKDVTLKDFLHEGKFMCHPLSKNRYGKGIPCPFLYFDGDTTGCRINENKPQHCVLWNPDEIVGEAMKFFIRMLNSGNEAEQNKARKNIELLQTMQKDRPYCQEYRDKVVEIMKQEKYVNICGVCGQFTEEEMCCGKEVLWNKDAREEYIGFLL